MARKTTNYGFNISEGTDLVNPLTDIFPNFDDIDTDLKGVSDSAVGTATELLTGTVHALVRSDSDRNVFTFTATSNFEAGETFTLDGVQVTALTPDGQTLSTGCYIIGSEVLVAVKGTLMTVYVTPSKALDSDKLDGHDSTYYATASDVSDLSGDVSALSSKVGIGTLTIGNDCVDGINILDGRLTQVQSQIASDTYTTSWKGKPFFFYKYGHIVIMTSPTELPKDQTLNAGSTTLFTVPQGFIPAQRTYGFCSNEKNIYVVANPDGVIWVYSPTTLTGAHNMGLTCVYFVN